MNHFGTAEFIAEAGTAGERKNIGVGQSVLHAKPPPCPPLRSSGGGGGAFVGISYNRQAQSFPRHGKLFAEFSTVWKLFFEIFPQYGKLCAIFSTLWKKFRRVFHAMENFFPHRGKPAENACFQPVTGCWFGAVERSTPRPM